MARPAPTAGCRAYDPRVMSVGVAVTVGAIVGLALGVLVSVTTDAPLAPEVGLVLGALAGWLSLRRRQ